MLQYKRGTQVRIDHLKLTNFTGFKSCEFTFHPNFNLLVGDNATGKTSVLDALSIALDSWVLGIKGDEKGGGIDSDQVRIVPYPHQDSFSFEKQFPSRIEVCGLVGEQEFTWARELAREGGRTSTKEAKNVTNAAGEAAQKVRDNQDITLPIISSYGVERLWFQSTPRKSKKEGGARSLSLSRLDGYRNCNFFEIQETELLDWIRAQVSVGHQRKKETLAFGAMKNAIIDCVEGATDLYYDERYRDVVVVMGQQNEQLFRNLSAGQRIMLTLVGELVKRATTLNPQLGDEVLRKTPGVVLIDELDLHLHPTWQRRVIHDLRRTFPSIQFIATTHSPQLIGEAKPEEIRVISGGAVTIPSHSFGMDSNRILEEVMGAKPRNEATEILLSDLAKSIDEENLDQARNQLQEVENTLGQDSPEVTGANTLIHLLDSTR